MVSADADYLRMKNDPVVEDFASVVHQIGPLARGDDVVQNVDRKPTTLPVDDFLANNVAVPKEGISKMLRPSRARVESPNGVSFLGMKCALPASNEKRISFSVLVAIAASI